MTNEKFRRSLYNWYTVKIPVCDRYLCLKKQIGIHSVYKSHKSDKFRYAERYAKFLVCDWYVTAKKPCATVYRTFLFAVFSCGWD